MVFGQPGIGKVQTLGCVNLGQGFLNDLMTASRFGL
jgi:hypothetical protein